MRYNIIFTMKAIVIDSGVVNHKTRFSHKYPAIIVDFYTIIGWEEALQQYPLGILSMIILICGLPIHNDAHTTSQ